MGIRQRLTEPVDAASLAVFRMAFGALLLVLVLRYFEHGWISEYFLQPKHLFKYWGFGWVRPLPGVGMYVVFGVMAVCALGVALGYRYRTSVLGYGLLFAYQHLLDKTHYLNHYYLVACVCGLMACLPLAATWSLDARRGRAPGADLVPTYALWALRAQLGLVYVFGGLAKLNEDWLLRAEPLRFWLQRKSELWLLGPLASQAWLGFSMSWAGAAFDLCIVPLLLARKTRRFAFVALFGFHLATAQLFSIGMFPYLMMAGSLLFAEPNWPRRLLSRLGVSSARVRPVWTSAPTPRLALPVLGLYFALQLVLPLRHWLYPGDARWTEQGFRFSWSVMVMEKNGSVDFRVLEPQTGRVFHVAPSEYFTPYQVAMMAPQPDMVQEAARVVAQDFRSRGVAEPKVFVDAYASLNGRAMQRLIDPSVDLSRAPDGLAAKPWILPLTPRPQESLAVARSME
ncbi:MAG: HTTM domain-containing protein [Myxococcales bacterium]|nr:MAG: HTTM domain-containing protein [Myxococcales bacterium]